MPCPFFEPLNVVTRATWSGARLPLIEEYEGNCHANVDSLPVTTASRFAHCNHGYCQAACPRFPKDSTCSAVRFDVISEENDELSILYVEESDHIPQRWQRFKYAIATSTLEPQLPTRCAEAQARAFCMSFLRRFY